MHPADLAHLVRLVALAGNLGVHCIRRQVDVTGPGDRAVIDEDLLKKPHIQQGRERALQLFRPQLHTPRRVRL